MFQLAYRTMLHFRSAGGLRRNRGRRSRIRTSTSRSLQTAGAVGYRRISRASLSRTGTAGRISRKPALCNVQLSTFSGRSRKSETPAQRHSLHDPQGGKGGLAGGASYGTNGCLLRSFCAEYAPAGNASFSERVIQKY